MIGSVKKKSVLAEVLVELHCLDVSLFKLGTLLGAHDACEQEIAEALRNFFICHNVGNKLAQMKILLRNEFEKSTGAIGTDMDELDHLYEERLSKSIGTEDI